MTITDFLLARIAMDKVLGREMSKHDAAVGMPGLGERLLRECEAKRHIVEHSKFLVSEGAYPDLTRRERSWTDRTLCILAAVYVDHPDYDPEWRLS